MRPLYRIAALVAALNQKSSCDIQDVPRADCLTRNRTTVLLGPATSGVLKQMRLDKDCSQAGKGCQQAVRGILAKPAELNFLHRATNCTRKRSSCPSVWL